MKTLFLSLQGISPLHQATEAELILQRLQRGNVVEVLHCAACLRTCSLNSTHNLLGCAVCQSRAVQTARLTKVATHQLSADLFPQTYPGLIPSDLTGLLELKYDDLNIGRGVVSSTISILREYLLDPEGDHRELIELELCNAVGALLNYRRVLDVVQPDEVVLFNGRHSELWPMIELCQQKGIDYVCHERGSSIERYQEFRNSLPHSIATRRLLMDALWETTPAEERTRLAMAWFESKRRGDNKDDRSYLGAMKTGSMPDNFDAAQHNIVVFNSSEDELQAISEWETPLFRHQNEVIERLLNALQGRTDVHIYLRMHPNLKNVDNSQTQGLYELKQVNFTLLPPQDPVDTYRLLEAADVVLSFASTVGIEATYWGTPSVLYGRAFYEGENAVYHPESFTELLQILTATNLKACTRDRALKYGLFASSYGQPYTYARIETAKTAYIGNEKIRRFTPLAVQNLLRYLPQISRWLRTHRIVTGHHLRLRQITKLYSHLKEKI